MENLAPSNTRISQAHWQHYFSSFIQTNVFLNSMYCLYLLSFPFLMYFANKNTLLHTIYSLVWFRHLLKTSIYVYIYKYIESSNMLVFPHKYQITPNFVSKTYWDIYLSTNRLIFYNISNGRSFLSIYIYWISIKKPFTKVDINQSLSLSLPSLSWSA